VRLGGLGPRRQAAAAGMRPGRSERSTQRRPGEPYPQRPRPGPAPSPAACPPPPHWQPGRADRDACRWYATTCHVRDSEGLTLTGMGHGATVTLPRLPAQRQRLPPHSSSQHLETPDSESLDMVYTNLKLVKLSSLRLPRVVPSRRVAACPSHQHVGPAVTVTVQHRHRSLRLLFDPSRSPGCGRDSLGPSDHRPRPDSVRAPIGHRHLWRLRTLDRQ
jgi:hypothetical protein